MVRYGLALLLWSAVLFRVPAVCRDWRRVEAVAYWVILFALTLTATLLLGPVDRAIAASTGIHHLTLLIANSCALVAALAVQILILAFRFGDLATPRRGVHVRCAALVVALGTMAILFALAPLPEGPIRFMSAYARIPFMTAYLLVYFAFLATALVEVVGFCWPHAHLTPAPLLKCGLRLTAVGGILGLVYVANELALIGVRHLGTPSGLTTFEARTQLLLAIAHAFLILGSTIPSWGPRLGMDRCARWILAYIAHARLYRLWSALCRQTPQIALVPPSSRGADLLRMRDLDFRLYRRIIEIRDGWLAVRPYTDPAVRALAQQVAKDARLSKEDAQALEAAADLLAGMHAKQGRMACRKGRAVLDPGRNVDVQSETAELQRLARFTTSPLLRHIWAHLDASARAAGEAPT